MPNTIISPDVFADAVNENLDVKLRACKLATDYTEMVEDITTCGEVIHFPTFNRIGDAVVVEKGTSIVPDEVNMSDSTATVKQVGHGVRIYDKDLTQVKCNAMKADMALQLCETIAKRVDADLVDAIYNEATYKDSNADLDATILDTAFDVFGDDVDNDTFAGILIHSELRKKFMAMDAFTSIMKTNASKGNGIVQGGCIGYWNGDIPVYVSKNGTKRDGKCLCAIVKKGALGIVWQKGVSIEEERESKLLATDIVANVMYATKLLHADGVSVLEIGA